MNVSDKRISRAPLCSGDRREEVVVVAECGLRTALIASLWAAFIVAGSTAADGEMLSIDRWPTTTWYRYDFNTDSGQGEIRLTAVDRYVLFLNGQRAGAGADWTALKEHSVTFEEGDNHLALVVDNDGTGSGAGLMVEIVAGNEQFVSTVTGPWYWSGLEPVDDAWLTDGDIGNEPPWQRVQNATFDRSRISGFHSLDVEPIAGFPGGVETSRQGEGALQLRLIDGQNLAAGMFAAPAEITDGDLQTAWNLTTGALNDFARVDLGRRRSINRVRVVTEGDDAEELEGNSLRGYSVQISDDRSRWTEVGALFGITEFRETGIGFPAVAARHLRIVVTEVARGLSPSVAELEVFGTGFAESASYLSPPLAFDAPAAPKNFGLVTWEAEVPERTQLSLQFRSAGADMEWSDWSRPYSESGVFAEVPEPRTSLQYRANLATSDNSRTPALRSLQLRFDEGPLAVDEASASISPRSVPMGRDTTFVYELNLDFSGDEAGVEKLAIDVPSRAEAAGSVTGPDGEALPVDGGFDVLRQQFVVTFTPPIAADDGVTSLRIPFTTAQFLPRFDYRAHLFAPGTDNPLEAAEDRLVDETTGEVLKSWAVSVSAVLDELLVRAEATPRVITPNADGRNDFTVIELVISKLAEPQDVEIRLFDLSGRLVRTLPTVRLSAGTYLHPRDATLAGQTPGFWDGVDRNGNLVPPGNYLYRVGIDLGDHSEVGIGTVAVVY